VDVIHIEDIIGHESETRNGQKLYSLWDTYVFADFVTYPSLWEGWGNQLLEALRAKLPILIFEYPVYTADIKPMGFKVVSLGSEIEGYDDYGLAQVPSQKIDQAVKQAVDLLTNCELRERMVKHNFNLGKEYYSIDALRKYLGELIQD